MLVAIASIVAAVAIYLIADIVILAFKNRQAHQFFKLKVPNLPVVPDPDPLTGHLVSLLVHDKNYLLYEKYHEKYGPTFGFFKGDVPNVATTDLDLIKLIEIDEAHKHINRLTWNVPVDEFHYSIFQARDNEWRQARRAVAPALTNHKVRSEEVVEIIDHVLKKMGLAIEKKFSAARQREQAQTVILDIESLMERYAMAVIFLLTYKKDSIDFESENDYWTDAIHKSAENVKHKVLLWGSTFPAFNPIAKFLVQFVEVGKAPKKLRKFVLDAVSSNLKARKNLEEAKKAGYRRTLIDYLIDAYLDRKIQDKTFFATGAFMIMAGFETTATTLTGLFWVLARDLELQEKLRRALLTEGPDCDFVTWTIYEAVRWLPAVISGTGRVLGEDVTVNGITLPKGVHVLPSTWAIHRDPKIWPEPEKFIPERFRDSSGRHPAAFMGFGLGPRNCVGAKLAIQEMRMMINFMLSKYKLESCHQTPEKFEFTAPGCLWLNLDEPLKLLVAPL